MVGAISSGFSPGSAARLTASAPDRVPLGAPSGMPSPNPALASPQARQTSFSDNPSKNACFGNPISLFSMIEFPVSKKQGITRQSIAMIAFSQDIQRRMRTDTENSIYAHVGFDSTAKLAFCDFVSSGTQTVSGTNPTGGIDPLPQFQPNTASRMLPRPG